MDVTSTQPAYLTASPAQYAQAEDGSAAMVSSDFETFLKMLTAQMENQDPLNPIESTDYAVQLATFSGVEQQVRSNDLLEGLGAKLGLLGMTDVAGWVGMEARVAAPVYFDQSPVTLIPEPAIGADQVSLVVRNSAGVIVENKSIPVSNAQLQWTGKRDDGSFYPTGVYSFELVSSGEGRHLSSGPVQAFSRITETQNERGDLWLVLESGERVPAESVSGLREAD